MTSFVFVRKRGGAVGVWNMRNPIARIDEFFKQREREKSNLGSGNGELDEAN